MHVDRHPTQIVDASCELVDLGVHIRRAQTLALSRRRGKVSSFLNAMSNRFIFTTQFVCYGDNEGIGSKATNDPQ